MEKYETLKVKEKKMNPIKERIIFIKKKLFKERNQKTTKT